MAQAGEAPDLHEQLGTIRESFQEFAYIVSHDLNAPLRECVCFSRLLEQKYAHLLNEQARQYLRHVLHGGGRAQVMIEGLLNYSRLDTMAESLEENIDTVQVVQECRKLLKDRFGTTGARLEVAPLPHVQADRSQLGQLFACLLDNALKFVRAGDVPQVRIEGTEEKTAWCFCMKDNGIGITPKDFEEIFKPLRQLHAEADYPGVGMGLALAQKIVQRHHGRIWVESALSEGSSFWFTLSKQPYQESQKAA